MKMPQTPEEVAHLIEKRDGISYNEALIAVRDCMAEMESYIEIGDLNGLEECLRVELGLEPDYIDSLIM